VTQIYLKQFEKDVLDEIDERFLERKYILALNKKSYDE